MIRWLVAGSLKFRLLVLTLAAAVLVLGATQLRKAPVDVLPEFTPPYVEIQTEALGLSPAEVEQLITVPLEADLLNGVEGVDVIRSQSVAGLSSIVMVFEPETEVYLARARVQERLTQAHALPQVSKPPTMLQPLSSSSRLLMFSIASDKLTPVQRSVIARWTVRPRLMGVPGVANVAIWGQRERQLQVQVDPEHLRDQGVTLQQVVETTGNAQIVSPLSFLEASTPGTGGFIETQQQRLQVRHVFDNLATPEDLGKVPVDATGGRLRLTDVADIVEDHQPLIGDAIVGDRGQGLLLVVEKFPGANTVEVTEAVEDALEKLRPGLSGMQVDTSLFRPAGYIADAIDHLTLALVLAGGLLALGLAAWFFEWRTTLVALVSMPVSLTAAALVLDLRGETFNAIAFAGLAAAVAIVIDDAVSGADGVARRLRPDRVAGSPAPLEATITDAFVRSRSPLGYAALIGLLSIVPVVVMEGRPGDFFEPLALSYALAVAASLAVALTVAPALSLLVFSRAPISRVSPGLRRLAPRYDAALGRAVGRPRAALAAVGAAAVFVLVALPLAGSSVLPTFKDRDVLVHLDGGPGTSQPAMTQAVSQASSRLRAIPGVETVGGHVGRAVTGDQVVDVNSGELWVRIDPGANYDKTMAAIDRVAGGLPGLRHDVVTYSGQRMRAVGALDNGANDARSGGLDVLTGADEALVARVYGEDLDVMRSKAEEIRQAMAQVDGVVDPRVRLPATQDTLEIEVDLEKAQSRGLKPGDVRRAEATLLQGIQVGSIFEGQKVFDVIVQGVPSTRQSVDSVRDLLIDTPSGRHVRLGEVADVRVTPQPTSIDRDAVARRLDVVAGVRGRSVGDASDAVEEAIADITFPLEHHAEVITASTHEEIDTTRILGFGIGVLVAVFLLLQAAFRSWRLAAIGLLTLPAALAGGVLVALIDGPLSFGALVGLLAVLGIAVRNVLLLFRHAQELERDTGRPVDAVLIGDAARDRLSAVVGTAGAMALVALPFVVMGSRAGLEIVHPMALVLLGGLVTSTLLALFVLPALYLRVAGRRVPAPVGARPGTATEPELV
jgi:Cu/Ag efflux pump CusA